MKLSSFQVFVTIALFISVNAEPEKTTDVNSGSKDEENKKPSDSSSSTSCYSLSETSCSQNSACRWNAKGMTQEEKKAWEDKNDKRRLEKCPEKTTEEIIKDIDKMMEEDCGKEIKTCREDVSCKDQLFAQVKNCTPPDCSNGSCKPLILAVAQCYQKLASSPAGSGACEQDKCKSKTCNVSDCWPFNEFDSKCAREGNIIPCRDCVSSGQSCHNVSACSDSMMTCKNIPSTENLTHPCKEPACDANRKGPVCKQKVFDFCKKGSGTSCTLSS